MPANRRQFIKGLAAGSVLPLLGGCYANGLNSRVVDLTARSAKKQLLANGAVTEVFDYANSPGPVILRARQGERFTVRFRNDLEKPTTIHWHGIRLDNAMDGVPFLTQDPVAPGSSFHYEFTPPDAGSFWFHPHFDSLDQMARGLNGVLIVEEREDPGFDLDLPLMLKDWVLTDTGEFGRITSKRGMSRAGTFGNIRTVNHQINPLYHVPAGGWVRLRLINVDLTRVYKIILDAVEMPEAFVIAVDGNPIASPSPFGREHIGPGQRLDVAVKVPDRPGAVFAFRNTSSSKPWEMCRFQAERADDVDVRRAMPRLPLNPIPEPDLAAAKEITYRFDSGVGDGYAICGGIHEKVPTFWTINGIAWPEYAILPPPLDVLEMGRSYIFELANHTPHTHPIHIHGLTFKILESNKRAVDPFHTDTVLLRPDERVRAAFVADNPGHWMFHCHIIEHQVSGMMGHLQVV
ncbi:multicopper oxidase family protein [Aestuariispira insulae]|uniref:FtsP/CotA-like multicopper oxidase with cupredoxin domain n=1 Tax=Aestuariispira insulae TaxID=1461337 RepID=A0A3D9H5F8_9PROT|nr:multicopper oxidase family protein [Aestuariispira insulae]RED44682.1 FtsP/CotA-like multicopper oxidase with cupredoxin domain [Aestuariispira insulae]